MVSTVARWLACFFLLYAGSCTHSYDRVDDYKEILKQDSPKELIHYHFVATRDMPELHLNLEPYRSRKEVQRWIDYFTGKGRKYFARLLSRGERYRGMINYFLRKEGLPSELYYMALIESGFMLEARSSMQALGLWQFMPATGKRYGLSVNSYVDERIDPIRATIAATRYFHDLHQVFHSWTLAMAAYGAGEMRIVGAIMSRRSRDYWHLCDRKALPPETRSYIPKFIAAAIIGQNREAYGFSELVIRLGEEPLPIALSYAKVPGSTSLQDLAQASKLDLEQLRKLNPHFLRGLTPPGKSYALWLPLSVDAQHLEQALSSLQKQKQQHSRARKEKSSPARQLELYRVRRGDTLLGIAKKYGLSVGEIKKINGLKNSRIYPGQQIRLSRKI